jgi:drug/metabolite transporter (DMT)-like permease
MSPTVLYQRFSAHPLAGIGFYTFAMLCFSIMNTLIRDVTQEVAPSQAVFMRNLFSFLFLLPVALHFWRRTAPSEKLWLHFWRAAVGLFAMETWFLSLSLMPVSHATALSFTTPLFATLFAFLFLREPIGPWRIGALVVGFLGALVILRPWEAGGFDANVAIVLFSAAMMAVASIVVKRLAATEPAWRVVFYMATFMSLLSAPMGLWQWQPVSTHAVIQVAAIALASTVAQLAMVRAFSNVGIVLLMPFDFLRLVFTASLAVTFLGETIDAPTLLGAAIIVASSALIAWRETRRKEQPTSPSLEVR